MAQRFDRPLALILLGFIAAALVGTAWYLGGFWRHGQYDQTTGAIRNVASMCEALQPKTGDPEELRALGQSKGFPVPEWSFLDAHGQPIYVFVERSGRERRYWVGAFARGKAPSKRWREVSLDELKTAKYLFRGEEWVNIPRRMAD